MPRRARQTSGTGIYHVMMRGINHQNIFEELEDYYQFIATLNRMRVHYDEEVSPSGINCTYYAYCLMSNHFHLLIREREERVGVTNSSAFQVLEDKSKRMVLKELKDKGASYRQLERLTGVGRGLIQKL